MNDLVHARVLCAFRRLLEADGDLFECPIEEHTSYDARKLHEVRINHRLANHLEVAILPVLSINEPLFVDIEFNRQGMDFKQIRMSGEDQTVRPDIIIHNRKTGCRSSTSWWWNARSRARPKRKLRTMRKRSARSWRYAIRVQVWPPGDLWKKRGVGEIGLQEWQWYQEHELVSVTLAVIRR